MVCLCKGTPRLARVRLDFVDQGRKRVLLIAASILAARKLAQFEDGERVPATVQVISQVRFFCTASATRFEIRICSDCGTDTILLLKEPRNDL